MTVLTKWSCESCGDDVTVKGGGLVAWSTAPGSGELENFRIIHKGACDTEADATTMELHDMVGSDGQSWLLSLLSLGPIIGHAKTIGIRDLDGFVDLFRRLQTPGYEEARPYFSSEFIQDRYSDASEVYPYTPEQLELIAEGGKANAQ